jgi:hypothetical protein
MPTLKAAQTPGNRVEVGDTILERAKNHDTAVVKARLTAFAAVHGRYVKASEAADAALANWRAALAVVAERDVDQDDAVDALALALANDGASRTAPFKGISAYSPSRLKALASEAEAKALRKVAANAAKRRGASKDTLDAARRCVAAAAAVESSQRKAEKPLAAYHKALASRDAWERPWEAAFVSLKRGARFHDEEGTAKGLYAGLFAADAPAPKRASKKKPDAPPVA